MLYSRHMKLTLQEAAQIVQGSFHGDPHLSISGITNSENPLPGHITFAQTPLILKKLEETPVSCLILSAKLTSSKKPYIQVSDPKLAWARLLRKFYPAPEFPAGISQQAYISPSAKIGKNVTIEAFAFVSEKAEIGDNTVLRSHVFIGEYAKIGKSSILHSGVKIYDQTIVGNSVTIHANTVIGADGFGYVTTPSSQEKVPQVGCVVIEDHVEIGACSTIDRATIGCTRIGEGAKIDNQVQIGHNVTIGSHTIISAQTGISGSSKVGAHVTMGGKVGLGDHVEIGDWTMVGAGSGFPSGKKVPSKQIVFGEPARPYAEARKQIAAQLRSAEMLEEIKSLRKRLEILENRGNPV